MTTVKEVQIQQKEMSLKVLIYAEKQKPIRDGKVCIYAAVSWKSNSSVKWCEVIIIIMQATMWYLDQLQSFSILKLLKWILNQLQ